MAGFSLANLEISARSRSYTNRESISCGNYGNSGMSKSVERRQTMTTSLVEELVEEFNVDEHGAHIGKLVGRHIKENLRAKHIVLRTRLALFGFQSGQP
jgi:hypothetical protein